MVEVAPVIQKDVSLQGEWVGTLEGYVNFADKNLIVENPFNLPRQLMTNLTATVTWTDNRSEYRTDEATIA